MRIGIHKLGNGFPQILRYLKPTPLLLKDNAERVGYQVYKWLWFYITLEVRE